MSDDGTLRQWVRQAIEGGKLPDRAPVRTWGGHGCGAPCAICNEQIGIDEVELELEFSAVDELGCRQVSENGVNGHAADNGAHFNGEGNQRHPNWGNLHMHPRCHSAWDSVRQEKEQTQAFTGYLSACEGDGTISARERHPRAKRGSE